MHGFRVSRRTVLAGALAHGLVGSGPVPVASASGHDGISWPRDQELPTFSRPDRLHALFMRSDTSADVQVLVTTLQGLVNRTRPQMYIVRGDPSEGARTWLHDSGVPYKEYTDPWKVIRRFLDDAKEDVVYDPQVVETINVATTVAGLRDGVVVSPELAAKLTKPPYRKRVLDDFRGRFSSNLEATRWQFEHLFPLTSHRLVLGINPGTPPPHPAGQLEGLRGGRSRGASDPRRVQPRGLRAGPVRLRRERQALPAGFQDSKPSDGWGGAVHRVVLTVDGETVADFRAGDESERAALFDHGGAGFKPQRPGEDSHRFADGSSYFVYESDVPASAREIVASIDMFHQFLVSTSKTASAVSSDDRIPASLPLRDYAVALKAMPFWTQSNDSPEEADLMRQIYAAHERGTPYLRVVRRGVRGRTARLRRRCLRAGGGLLRELDHPQWLPGADRTPAAGEPATVGDQGLPHIHLRRRRQRTVRPASPPADLGRPEPWDGAAELVGEPSARRPGAAHYQPLPVQSHAERPLVAGPSGAGYFFPSFWPQDHLPTFLEQNKPYFDRLGLSVIYALDDIPALEEASAQAYVDELGIDGIVYNVWAQRSQTTIMAGSLPVSTQISHTDRNEILARIKANAAESFDGTKPLFIAVGVPSWDLGPTDVAWIMEQLGEEFVAVRADQYFALVREAHGIATS